MENVSLSSQIQRQYWIIQLFYFVFVNRVVESKHPDYAAGSECFYRSGWRSHSIVNPDTANKEQLSLKALPEMGDLPHSLALGTLGMPGYVVLLLSSTFYSPMKTFASIIDF